MSLSLKHFVRNAVASRLMTRGELSDFLGRLPTSNRPADGEQLARLLVKKKLLTKYQASMLFHGRIQGLVFGDYVVIKPIGAGGMGHVFQARHRKMDGVVALKALPPEGAKNGPAFKRFQREVRLSARLKHQNIVTTYDTSEQDGAAYLVMEYVDGHDLSALVKQTGPLEINLAVNCVSQAARALRHAHACGVIHRDIKPANLLLDKRGTVKILDLGVALAGDGDDDRALLSAEAGQSRVLVGTVDYMSPEQARDASRADARSDIYSLGCTLYYLLAGQRPYEGETIQARLRAHREAPIPSLRACATTFPKRWRPPSSAWSLKAPTSVSRR